jgi:hypothetical protein
LNFFASEENFHCASREDAAQVVYVCFFYVCHRIPEPVNQDNFPFQASVILPHGHRKMNSKVVFYYLSKFDYINAGRKPGSTRGKNIPPLEGRTVFF